MLLDTAAEMAAAAGVCVLRASGVEFEASISFSGLNQTLLPLLAQVARLTASHRDALDVALGFSEGPAHGSQRHPRTAAPRSTSSANPDGHRRPAVV
jgi:hypothetical protein